MISAVCLVWEGKKNKGGREGVVEAGRGKGGLKC